jgi:regulatory protein
LSTTRPEGRASQARALNDNAAASDDACYAAALKLLGYRSRTESEMSQRLGRKGFEASAIERAIERLKASGLIDDAAFARRFSENRQSSSPRSGYLVKRELQTRGVDRATSEEAVADLDDIGAAYQASLGRLKRLQALPSEEAGRKLADFLRRRGFNWTTIEQILNRLREEGLLARVDTT